MAPKHRYAIPPMLFQSKTTLLSAKHSFGSVYASMLRFRLRCYFPHYFKLSNVYSFIFGIFFGGRVATTCFDGWWSCGDYLDSVRSNLIVYYDLKDLIIVVWRPPVVVWRPPNALLVVAWRPPLKRRATGSRVATTKKMDVKRLFAESYELE